MPALEGALPEWPRAHGDPLFPASIRNQPSDFQVVENLGFEFSGSGEHDYLWIEKTGANTEWVARQLARHAEVPAKDVGYAGLKDRHAVTQQWFSVPRWHSPDWQALDVEGVADPGPGSALDRAGDDPRQDELVGILGLADDHGAGVFDADGVDAFLDHLAEAAPAWVTP